MALRKGFTALFILLLLLSTFVAIFHHHDNTEDDHDCPICLVIHRQHASGQTTIAFDGVPFSIETIYIVSALVIAAQIVLSSQGSRAPPA